MARIFLSYGRRNVTAAEGLAKALERAGHDVWWDRNIRGGRRFEAEIEAAMAAAEAIVVLWSADAIKSDWVKDEAAAGRDSGRLVPATLDGTLPPLGFRQFQTLDLTGLRPAEAGRRLDAAIVSLAENGPDQGAGDGSVAGSSRRTLLLGGGAALGLAAIGLGAWRWWPTASATASPEVEALLAQAWQAWTQGDADGIGQAIGLYKRATEIEPDFADSWGLLCCAYGDNGHGMSGAVRGSLWQRAEEAGQTALRLDPKNAYGRIGIAYARPLQRNWGLMEQAFRQAEKDQPGKFLVVYSLALLLGEVGRNAEAAALFGSLKGTAPTAMQYGFHTQALWASGQPVAAERLINEASDIFASHPFIWQQRLDLALHSGRATTALAQLEDSQSPRRGCRRSSPRCSAQSMLLSNSSRRCSSPGASSFPTSRPGPGKSPSRHSTTDGPGCCSCRRSPRCGATRDFQLCSMPSACRPIGALREACLTSARARNDGPGCRAIDSLRH